MPDDSSPDDTLRYPVGPLPIDAPLTDDGVSAGLFEIAALPTRLAAAVAGLNDEQLDTPYRPGGWTVRQVVHHLADSHMNAYVRFRLALTVHHPAIVAYDESAWAELPDARSLPVTVSLTLLEALHARWTALLGTLDRERLRASAYRHSELGLISIERAVAIYAWHGRHHVAHITALRERNGW